MTEKILAVDDEQDMTKLLRRTLEPELDCHVLEAFNGSMALDMLEAKRVSLVICDIKMPGMDGFELLEHIRNLYPDMTVVMLTAFGNIESAVAAIKKGAYDFISKPFEQDEIIFKIKKAMERSRLLSENKRLLQDKSRQRSSLIGESEAMKKVYEKIGLVAQSDVNVLITGESGTGKDLTARSIHSLSNRKDMPFIPVNCPAIPEHILESELFGYKKGAFTNAFRDKTGMFQEADKGTIFLDEIGDVGPSIQTKLLRVIQEKEIRPLGDSKSFHVDVRIIASTNQVLEQKIEQKEFREDLFYRLSVITIELPPLRHRINDIPLLAHHLLSKHCKKMGKPSLRISDEAIEFLMKRSWKGNVRELENVLIQSILYAREKEIKKADVPVSDSDRAVSPGRNRPGADMAGLVYKDAKENFLKRFNHEYIGSKLLESHGNITQAAKESGLERQALQQIMRRFDIDPEKFRK